MTWSYFLQFSCRLHDVLQFCSLIVIDVARLLTLQGRRARVLSLRMNCRLDLPSFTEVAG